MARLLIVAALLAATTAMLSGSSNEGLRLSSTAHASPMSDLKIFNYNPIAAPGTPVIIGNARFTPLSDYMVRMEYTDKLNASGKPVFEDRSTQTFVNRYSATAPQFSVSGYTVDGVTTTVLSTPQVTIKYVNGQPFSAQSLTATTAGSASWSFGDVDNQNLLGTVRSLDELCTISLNCTENAATQIHDESLHCSWGVVSRGGWTTVDDSNAYIMSAVEGSWFNTSNKNTNTNDVYFLGHGNNYRDALKDYTTFAGRVPLPRKQHFGAWFTRWYDYANGDVERLIGLFEQYRLPLDTLVLDMNWHTKNDWTGYTFDPELYPSVKQMTDFIHNKGLLLAANIHDADGIGWFEESFEAMCKANGVDPSAGIAVPFQPLNAQYMHTLSDITMKPLGIDAWWIDWQQGGWAGMCTNDDMNPTFITNHVRMTDAIRRGENVRSSILARWGGSGSHRYPVGFSGDVSALTWECFAYQPYFSLTAANVAYGTISHDLVGPADDHELHVRWMQFGAFSGIMRIHDRGMSAGSCWDDCPIVDLWLLPPSYFNPIRDAMLLREALLPYIYTHNRFAYDNGTPLTYPMYYDSPAASDAYLMDATGVWAQYMFGPSILVAPVTVTTDDSTGLAAKNIWLPMGTWWDDVYGALVTVTAPQGRRILQQYDVSEIPLFYKAGAVIPRLSRPSELAAASKVFDEIDLFIYPGATSGSATMYDDDGSSYNYVNKAASLTSTTFSYSRSSDKKTITVTVQPPSQPLSQTINVRIVLVASQPIASAIGINTNGANATAVNYDGPTVSASVVVGAKSTAAPFTITITLAAPQVDSAFTGLKAFGYRGPLAKRTLDNFRTTPYSTTAGPAGTGMLKQMGSRSTYMSLLGNEAATSSSSSSELQQLMESFATLATNAVTEINSSPVNPPSGPPMTALVQLWSAARKDMLLCGSATCLEWNTDYAVFGIEGYQPASLAEPYAEEFFDYWSASANDNWADVTTTVPSGYTMAGFSNGNVISKTVPTSGGPYNNLTQCLQVWANSAGDHFTFASAASLAYAQANGYTQVESCIAYALRVVPSASHSGLKAEAAAAAKKLRHGHNHQASYKKHHDAAKTNGDGASLMATPPLTAADAMAQADAIMRKARAHDRKYNINRPAMRDRLLEKVRKMGANADVEAVKNLWRTTGWSANAYATSLIQTVIPASSQLKQHK